mmetsp:Transcript_24762/g.34583  ORF Transcript_24762/g.34583 Transcript_24762/m.34583 type:complete len:203 (-) Transcript_24762:254-862(-)
MVASLRKAASDQITNRPRCPPGASCSRLSVSTSATSTPGMFLKDLETPSLSAYTTSGPRFCTWRRLRSLPLPTRTLREAFARSTSSKAPMALRNFTASLVFSMPCIWLGTTRGISGHSSILWPRAMTRDGRAEAARAEATAYRFWLRLIFLCHLRQMRVGANMRPLRHMFPKAAWPAREVPPPDTRGIRETARPVPHDSAEC